METRNRGKWILAGLLVLVGGYFVETSLATNKAMTPSPINVKSYAPTPAPGPSDTHEPNSQITATQTPSVPNSSNSSTQKVHQIKPQAPHTEATSETISKESSTTRVPVGSSVLKKTKSGVLSMKVNTHKVIVAVPVSASPIPTPTSTDTSMLYPIDARTLITSPPDWTGFVAPKASFAGVLSCKKSTVLMQDWFTGKWEYPYLVTERWKLTGGNFLIGDDPTHYTEADTYYTTFPNEEFFTDNMNKQASSNQDFYFHPFNYVVGSTWADGTADTQRIVNYDVTSTYTQSQCN